MIFRGRPMVDPCLGDADTHASHMCQFPYHGGSSTAPTPTKHPPKSHRQPKEKTKSSSAFSFAIAAAKEKAIKKKTPEEDFALCGARQRLRVYPVSATPTHMLRICVNPLEPASLPKGLT